MRISVCLLFYLLRVRWAVPRSRIAVAAVLVMAAFARVDAQTSSSDHGFTLEQAMSAPFSNQLTAAPARGRVAWFTDAEGRRNVWVAGSSELARAVTNNTEDDGQDLDGLAWSPDAERLAWSRGTGGEGVEHPVPNPAELPGEIRQNVEIADLRTGAVRVIGEGHAPVFLDAETLLFLRKGDVWRAALGNAEVKPEQMLFVRGRATHLRVSPDGRSFALVSERGDHSLIGVCRAATRAVTWMDPGTYLDHDPAWSPDGERLAFVREVPLRRELSSRWMREGVPWSVRVADAETGRGQEFWGAAAGRGSLFHATGSGEPIHWADERTVVFPWERDGWLHLYAKTEGTGPPRLLTPGTFEVDAVSARGGEMVYSSNQYGADPADADRRHLWRVNVKEGWPMPMTEGTGIETSPALLSDGAVAMMHGGVDRPLTPALLPRTGGSGIKELAPALVPLSFPGGRFVRPAPVAFRAADGVLLHAQVFSAGDAAEAMRRPALLFFHGGPRRQMLLGFHPMEYYAQTYAMNQYLASRGFVVVSVNYRSGTGYGMEFRQAPHSGANGASEFADVLAAVRYLRSRRDVDSRRVGVWGGSYGGYLAALALARRSDLFAAGVDLHGVHDWALELDLWRRAEDPTLREPPTAQTAFASSPMAAVRRWRSPVLLVHGDDDRNVLFSQTVRLATALRTQGVPVEEMVLPDEVHDFLLHRSWLKAYSAAVEFFERTLMQGRRVDRQTDASGR